MGLEQFEKCGFWQGQRSRATARGKVLFSVNKKMACDLRYCGRRRKIVKVIEVHPHEY